MTTKAGFAVTDYAVACAEGLSAMVEGDCCYLLETEGALAGRIKSTGNQWSGGPMHYGPTHDPAEAMRLLEKYRIDLGWIASGNEWGAYLGNDGADGPTAVGFGHTPAIAICRAIAASKSAP